MPRWVRPTVAALSTAVLALAGCTVPTFAPNGSSETPAASQVTASAAPGGTAAWRPCPEVPRQVVGRSVPGMVFDCATVPVPQDWTHPHNGKSFHIALIRVRSATQQNRIGSLLVNPGGPGASGVDIAVYLSVGQANQSLPAAVTNRFDLIGFDPRGVGRSDPVKCISATDQDATFAAPPDPASQADFDAFVALNARIGASCGVKYGNQLPYYSTEQAARDMDAIRSAVGDDKLSYLGYSYGTLLGATYAQLYPKKIRAMVLDGAVDPKQGYVEGSEVQAKGFERAFTNFSTWCQQNTARCPIAPDARGAVTQAMADAARNPVRGADGRSATAGWIFIAVVSSLYSENGWPTLAKAIAGLRRGDAKGVFLLADAYTQRKPDGSYPNLFDANLAVNCADTKDVPSDQQIRKLQAAWRTKYPLFGAPLAVGMLSCRYWPGTRDPYPAGPAKGAPPIVVVGTTGDPATPYENTADLATMLGAGHTLTWEGEGHTAYPHTPCITDAVNRYLIDLQVPREGLRCPAK